MGRRSLYISVLAGLLSAAASLPAHVYAAAGDKLVFIQQPTAATGGAIISPSVTVQLESAGNAKLAQPGVAVTLTLSSGTGTLLGTTTRSTDATGLAVFNDLRCTLIGAKTLTAASVGFNSATSANFNITLGPPARLVIKTEPPATATAGVLFSPQPVLWTVDAGGNQVTTDNSTVVTASRLAGAGTLQGTLKASANKGVVTFANLSHTTASPITILFTSGTLPPDTSTTIQVTPAAAARLAFVQQPTATLAGALITPAVTVAVRDAYGNTLSTSGTAVVLALASGTGTLGGTLTQNSVSGVSTFNDLHINLAGSKTLSATSGTLTAATSTAFTISSLAGKALAFVQQPTNAVAGATIAPAVTVQLRDTLGNPVAAAGLPVTIAIASGTGTLTGTATRNTDSTGSATFSNLSINLAGSKTLSAASTGITSTTSSAFTITPGPAAALLFVQQPTNVIAGATIFPAVTVRLADIQGNTVPASGVSVTMALSTGTGTLTGTIPQLTDAAGVATFGNLSVNASGTKKFTASSSGLTSAASDTFVVHAAAAARLAFTASPAGGTAGTPFPVQPVVTLQDALGNTVTGTAQTVTLAILNDPAGGATLSGTKVIALNTVTGQAVFAGLSIDRSGAGYTLTATGSTVSTTPGSVQSAAFTVTAAAASVVRVETAANGSGTILAAQDVSSGTSITGYAIARDAFGNFAGNIAATQWALQNVTGGVLATDLTPSTDLKSAIFTGRQSGTAVINATAAGLTSVPSGTLTVVVAGPAASVSVETAANGTGKIVPAQTLSSGGSITVYAVERDASGYFIANIAADAWSLVSKTGGVADGDLVASSDRKSAKFTGKLIGSARIQATSGTLSTVTSGAIAVTAGAPASIASAGGTPQSVRIGSPFPAPLRAVVRDAQGNPVRGVQVTWTPPSSGAGGSFAVSGNTAVTDTTGAATSGTFTANTVAGIYTVNATVPGVAAPATFALANLGGIPARITPVSGTPQSAPVNTVFASTLAAIVKDSSGNGIAGAVVTFTAPVSGPGGTFPGGLASVAVAASSNGIATSPVFTAGSVAGSCQVTASVEGVTPAAQFVLINTPGPPSVISPVAGAPQTAPVGTMFPVQLVALVKDAFGNPVPKAQVLFTSPSPTVGGTFPAGVTDTSRTDTNGVATASPFTAGTIADEYAVSATVTGIPLPASFILTNTPGVVDTFLVDAAGGGAIGQQIAQVPFNIRFRANDRYGNLATQFNGTADVSSNGILFQAGSTTAPFTAGVLSSYSVALQSAGKFVITATRTGGAETGRSDSIQVLNPVPSITRLSPTGGTRGQTLTDTITGWGFLPGVTTVSFGDNVTTTTSVNSFTQITVTLVIDTAAANGARDVVLFNGPPGGGAGTLSSGFVIGTNPRPTLTAISPNTGGTLQRLVLNVSGTGFVSGLTRVSAGPGIAINSVTVRSAQLLTADVGITAAAAGGVRMVSVVNDPPGGGTSDSLAFTVNAPATAYPVPITPADSASGLDTVLTFSWHSWLASGVSYRLQLSPASAFTSLAFDDSTITDTTQKVGSLAVGTTYYWRVSAWNGVGSSANSPLRSIATSIAYPSSYAVADTIAFPSHALRSQFQATDFRLVVLPGGSGSPLGSFLQGNANSDWVAFWDNGAAANYLAAYDGSPTFLCTPGRAFWVLHNGPVSVSGTVPTAGLDTTRSVAIPLHSGWNLIGNPFNTPVSWSWVQAVNGPGPIAVPWSYDGSFQQATTLLPYQGYLFDNADSLSVLRIPFGRTLGKTPAFAGTQHTSAKVSSDWRIGITLTSGNVIDRSASIGVSPAANEGRDPLDLRMPRGVGTMPGVFFTRPGWDRDGSVFAADVRPEISSLESWPADVRAPVGQTAVLSFSGIENVPGAFGVVLIDDEADRTADLRKSPSYTFTPGVPVSRFRVVVGTPESLEGVLQSVAPRDFALEKNFPNPFNPSTTITVDIPRASNVSLTIYSILGAEVKTLYSGQIDAGRHFFVWNGTDRQGRPVSSGVYVVRLRNEAGRSFVDKMLLLK